MHNIDRTFSFYFEDKWAVPLYRHITDEMFYNCRKMTQSSSAKLCLSWSVSTEKQHCWKTWRTKSAGDDKPKTPKIWSLNRSWSTFKKCGKSVLFILFMKFMLYTYLIVFNWHYLFVLIYLKKHCEPLASNMANFVRSMTE